MNQAMLIETLSRETAVPASQVKNVLKNLGAIVQGTLAGGGEITIPGVAKLSVVPTKARDGRNPRTGAMVKIAAGRKAKAVFLKELRDYLAPQGSADVNDDGPDF
ncbi:HU family DNA-binding protein [Nitrospirillum amazonense]|uniref:HU family DNA-binding protein n=1 Tax=Nitrospirillum amazonense TaxID=28077 RepID=UPI0024129C8E|nr:HU family DNA-binding protein [Nitrospirillum amazonense]MDG3444682.1 HU family DNA-binding protein [Nitrospirillum amazonense]